MIITKIPSHYAHKLIPPFREVNVVLLIYLKTVTASVLYVGIGRQNIDGVPRYDNHFVSFERCRPRDVRRVMGFGDPNPVRVRCYALA